MVERHEALFGVAREAFVILQHVRPDAIITCRLAISVLTILDSAGVRVQRFRRGAVGINGMMRKWKAFVFLTANIAGAAHMALCKTFFAFFAGSAVRVASVAVGEEIMTRFWYAITVEPYIASGTLIAMAFWCVSRGALGAPRRRIKTFVSIRITRQTSVDGCVAN